MTSKMNPINIEKTFSTPSVVFSPETKTLTLEGRLIPENAEIVFKPINQWIDDYFADNNDTLSIVFRLYYYNTSSSKRIVNLFRKLDNFYAAGKKITATWEYEEGDDDCMHDGQDFKSMVKIPVNVIEGMM